MSRGSIPPKGSIYYMIDVCFWCKRSKDGQDGTPLYNDYEFCPICTEQSNQGITVIQIVGEKNGNPPISEGLYPTGKWVVVKEELIVQALEGHDMLDNTLSTRRMYIDKETWETLNIP